MWLSNTIIAKVATADAYTLERTGNLSASTVYLVKSPKKIKIPTQTVSDPCLTRNSRNALDGFGKLKTLLIGSNSQRNKKL